MQVHSTAKALTQTRKIQNPVHPLLYQTCPSIIKKKTGNFVKVLNIFSEYARRAQWKELF